MKRLDCLPCKQDIDGFQDSDEVVAFIACPKGIGQVTLLNSVGSPLASEAFPFFADVFTKATDSVTEIALPWKAHQLAFLGTDDEINQQGLPVSGLSRVPTIVTAMATFHGGDPAHLRITSVSSLAVSVFIGNNN